MNITKDWLQDNLKTGYGTSGTGFRLAIHPEDGPGQIVWNDMRADYNKKELIRKVYNVQEEVEFDEIILHGEDIRRVTVPKKMRG